MNPKEEQAIRSLSKRIKELRKKQGLTQAELSDKMGIEDGNYRKLENGKSNPTYLTLVRLCEGLEVEIEDLFRTS